MGSTSPLATPDDRISPKKRGAWHDVQQPGHCISPKKSRTWQDVQQPVQNLDWVSTMPDDILIKILSLMTVREAARTGCLSSKWKHLWENIHCLRLTARAFGMQVLEPNYHENLDFWNSEATKFVHKVNELLRHHSGNGVQRFKVRFPLTSAHAADLDRWVAFAATSGAKNLEFSLFNRHDDMLINVRAAHAQLLHMDVYKCKSLISISIHAEKLKCFSYMGHNVDVEYQYAPVIQTLHAHFVKKNECPLERIGALPELRKLSLQFLSRLQAYGNLHPQSKVKVIWPKKCTLGRLHTVRIGGFSGEPELMQLLFFLLRRSPVLKNLLIDPQQRHYQGLDRWKTVKAADDATRCYYARGVALTHLPPKVPSTLP
ncbi:hypothetical protein C2845_PM16G09190 [Panicum miliaceum]|uniref:Uncharacterized protein n=1 Tax=Panicum miliaceum TaxID=4540 RepID=A0A3L6PVK5_PANMI|nr:hypothetical protein C2845_PM16G09190 [Panicum miliaceum]